MPIAVYVTGFGLLVLSWGIWLYFQTLREKRLGRESASWPTAKATVLRSVARIDTDLESDRDRLLEVSYEYTVDGQRYRGQRIAFGFTEFTDETSARKRLAELPSGAQVDVFYLPSDPRVATLEPRYNDSPTPLLKAVIWTVIGGYIVWEGARRLL